MSKSAILKKSIQHNLREVERLQEELRKEEAEILKGRNVLILANVDALLLFAEHSGEMTDADFCRNGNKYNGTCPRCRLLEIQRSGYIFDSDEFVIDFSLIDHRDSE